MKNLVRGLLSLALLALLLSGPASAALVVEEQLDYPAGNIDGRNEGFGLDGATQSYCTTAAPRPAGGYDYPS